MDSEQVKEEYLKTIIQQVALHDQEELKAFNVRIMLEKSNMRDARARNPINFEEFKFRTTQRDPFDVNNLEERYEKFLQEFSTDRAERLEKHQYMIWEIEGDIASLLSNSLEYIELVRKNLFNQ